MPSKDEIKSFSFVIENLTRELRCEYLDAILYHCEKTNLELEMASTLLSPTLKAKIREQCEANNMLKKTSRLF